MNHNNIQASTDNFVQQRINMIEQQIRPWNVLDDRVLKTMMRVPREKFVPDRFRALAYSETRIPLGCHQEMIAPAVVGRILQALEIKPRHRILEIGTGSGYVSACLSLLGNKITSVEYHEPLFNQARQNLDSYDNVELIHGNALNIDDLPETDILLVNASVISPPEKLISRIGQEGRALLVLGSIEEPVMRVAVVEMKAGNPLHSELFETWLTPLISD